MENCFTFSLPYPNRDMSITIRCINNIPWFDEAEVTKLLNCTNLYGLEPYKLSSDAHTGTEQLISAKKVENTIVEINTNYEKYRDCLVSYRAQKWLRMIVSYSWQIVQQESEKDMYKSIINTLIAIINQYKEDVEDMHKDDRLCAEMRKEYITEELTRLIKCL